MSDNIYDIIGKLNGLSPKDMPISTSAEPVYESVDPQDITASVNSMMSKYQDFLVEQTAKKSQSQKDAEVTRGEPELVKLYQKARLERPTAASDAEALAYQMVKANKEIDKATAANDAQEKKIADLDAKVVALSTAKPAAAPAPTPAPAVTAQPTAAAPTTAPAARPSATILRMPTPARAEVPATAEVPAQAPAEVPVKNTAQDEVPADTAQTKKDAEVKGDQRLDITTTGTTKGDAANDDEIDISALSKVVDIKSKQNQTKKITPKGADSQKELPLNYGTESRIKVAEGYYKKQNIKNEEQASLDLVNIPPSPVLTSKKDYANYNNEKLEAMLRDPALTSVALLYPGTGKDYSTINLTRPMFDKLKSALASIKNPEMHRTVAIDVLSNRETASRYLTSAKGDKELYFFYDVKPNEVGKAFNLGLKANPQGRWYAVGQENPNATKTFGKPKTLYVSPPRGKLAGTQQESLGNDTMQENIKTNSILEGVRQVEIKKLKEAAKPDFLDLDKDGDTDEPMKSAAKSAKDDEPAKPDSDAVAKRKRLQALKDRQEDERAEKGDDYKSSSRKIKGRAYGGSAQKDDEEKDELEEGKMKEIYTDMMYLATKKGYSSHKQFTPADYDELGKKHNISGKDLAVALGHKKSSEVVESGLQYYTGKKKYGKEGMTALSKAGREGASEEELGRIKDKYKKEDIELNEKAVSKQQQKFMGMVHAVQKGKMKAPSKLIAKTAKDMSKSDARDFAATKHKGLPTKVTEGKEAIRNHPIYTNEQAWKHYSEELAEQEALEAKCMEAPVVDVQEELNEIARLAGLAPKMENLDPMVPGDSVSPLTHTEEGMGCSMRELEEAMSRKHYREMADKIKNMADRDDAEKICRTFVEMAKADNPRFKEDMFYAACGVKEDHGMMSEPSTVLVGEEETMDEGNEFTKARLDAIAAGKDTFTVGGKTYKVSGDTSAEKTQVESIDDEKQAVKEDINLNVTANGEEDVVNLIRKLSGMPMIAVQMPQAEEHCDTCGGMPCACEESVEEQRDIEHANTPHETVAPITAVTTDAGGGLGGVKKQYPLAANRGANPIEENLWKQYETMINDLKA